MRSLLHRVLLISVLGCGRDEAHLSLEGVWLPSDGAYSSYGFKLEKRGMGTLTSREWIEKYPQYRKLFYYSVSKREIGFKFIDEEGGEGAWQYCPYKLSDGVLRLESPPRPIAETSFSLFLRDFHDAYRPCPIV
jgi:hypothetical protein